MPQTLLLLLLLPFISCDTLTKIISPPILQFLPILYARDLDVWYRSTSNHLIRLTSPYQIPIPYSFLHFDTIFRQTTSNRVITYAYLSPADTPFYWTDGRKFLQVFYPATNSTGYNTQLILPVTSNNTDYVLSVFQQNFDYKLFCTQLQTNTTVALSVSSTRIPKVIPYNGGYYLSLVQIGLHTIVWYDPALKKIEVIDEWDEVIPIKLYLAYDKLLYEHQSTIRQYDIPTNITTFSNDSYLQSVDLIPSPKSPQQYMILGLDDALICQGDINKCDKHSIATLIFTFIPDANKIVYVPRLYPYKLQSYQIDTRQSDLLYSNLRMHQVRNDSAVSFNNFKYHQKSNNVLFIGLETILPQFTYGLSLFKFDMKTEMLSLVTNLCTSVEGACPIDIDYVLRNDDSVVFPIVANGTSAFYILKLETPVVPTREPEEHPGPNVAGIVVGVVFGLLITFFVVFMVVVAIRRYRKAQAYASQPYERVM